MDLLLRAGTSGGAGGGGGSYNPASYFTGGTSGPWYDFGDSTRILNGSSTSATNGQTVGTANDAGTSGTNASQTTDANRPILRAAHVNSRNAVQCDSTDFMDVTGLNSFLNSATSCTITAVLNIASGGANHSALRQYDNGFSYDRINALFIGQQPSIKYSKDGGDYANLRTAAGSLSTGTYHAVIWVFDFTNGQTGIYADNSTALTMAAAGGGTVPGAMNATNGNESRIVRTSDAHWADLYFHKNSMMDSTQRANWFAAVKSRFALTAY